MKTRFAMFRLKFKLLRVVCAAATLSLFITGLAAQPAAAATLPIYRYTHTLDTSPGGAAHTTGITVDKFNNVYIVGDFTGTVNFAGAGGSNNITAPNSSTDVFISKYKANGSYAWTKVLDSTSGTPSAICITTDSSGNVYIGGSFTGTVAFDGLGGSDVQAAAASNGTSAFMTRINANGSYGYTKFILSPNSGVLVYATIQTIKIRANGDIFVAGGFQSTQDFAGNDGTNNITDPGVNADSFWSKYNMNGAYQSTVIMDNSLNSNSTAFINGLAFDASGNIYAVGNFYYALAFDGVGGSDTHTSNPVYGNGAAYLTKYNANGTYAWTRVFDNNSPTYVGFSTAYGVIVDGSTIYTTGDFSGTQNFAAGNGTDVQTTTATDGFLAKYTTSGTYVSAKLLASTGSDYIQPNTLGIDPTGNLYLAGNFYGQVNFAGSSGSDIQGRANTYDVFLTLFKPNGSYGWTRTLDVTNGNAGEFSFAGAANDALGNVFLTSDFLQTVTFDGLGGSDTQTDAGGNYDSFLTSFQSFPAPRVISAPDTGAGTARSSDIFAALALIATGIAAGFGTLVASRSRGFRTLQRRAAD